MAGRIKGEMEARIKRLDAIARRLAAIERRFRVHPSVIAAIAVERAEPTNGHKPLTGKRLEELKRAIRRGDPWAAICGRFHCSMATIRKIKLEMNPKPSTTLLDNL